MEDCIDSLGRPYRIRPARPDDAGTLADLLRELAAVDGFILLTPEEVRSEPASQEPTLTAANRSGGHWVILVAEADGVGVFGMVTLKAAGLRRCAHVCELGIGIREEWRGRGVGRELMRSVLREAVLQGFRKVRLMVIASNHRAIRLYHEEGFIETGRFREEVRMRWGFEDLIVMERMLP